jgi:high affinity Mn2+ porin
VRRIIVMLACAVAAGSAATARAQSDTLLDHPGSQWFYAGGQINIITQHHGDFPSPYEGPNSLRPAAETATSRLLTLYLGARRSSWDVVVDVESAGGSGIGDALGLAGFTNLDVVRNPTLGATPYLARLIVHKTFALSEEQVDAEVTPLSLAARLPARRVEVRVGRFGLADFLDLNAVLSDSHRQFTNWTADNNGAYDYAADTRGYTYGAIVEFATPRWSIRGAEALMPTVANGIEFDTDVRRARGENVELELRQVPRTIIRLLGYANHANMGSYREAIDAFQAGLEPRPDIEAHREPGRVKYGAGANLEYAFSDRVRAGARAGWNEGANESFAYTEVNSTLAGGVDVAGAIWRRDRAGVAVISNGLSDAHREYLRLGGTGFLLGDGTLRYGRESIVETYYTAPLWRGVAASAGAQIVARPGYNRDRGPVVVWTLRLHLDI